MLLPLCLSASASHCLEPPPTVPLGGIYVSAKSQLPGCSSVKPAQILPHLLGYRPLRPPPFLARLVCWLPPTESTPHLTSIPITSSTTSSSSERTPAHPNLHLYPWNLSLTPGILLTHTACLVPPASWRTWLTCFSLTQGAQSRTFLFQRT